MYQYMRAFANASSKMFTTTIIKIIPVNGGDHGMAQTGFRLWHLPVWQAPLQTVRWAIRGRRRKNGQRHLQMSPIIMKVAVPPLKHSPRLGQLASSHTVASLRSRNIWRTRSTVCPVGMRLRIHGGLRSISGHW